MEGVSLQEMWMLLGEKDVQIFQMLKTIEKLTAEVEKLQKMLSLQEEEKSNG